MPNLQSSGTHEVLLLEAELLSLKEIIIRVQDPGNILRNISVYHSLYVVAIVNCNSRQNAVTKMHQAPSFA
jgi:hypothetical protein